MSTFIRTSVPDPERRSAQALLTKLLYNNLAKEMNLDGGNAKIGFRCLNIHKVFQGKLMACEITELFKFSVIASFFFWHSVKD